MQWSDFQNLFYLKNQKETLEIVTLKLREWNPHIPEGQPCILLKAVCRSFQSYFFVKRSLQMKTIYSYISYILHFRDNFSLICNKNENLSSKVNSLFLQNTDIVTSLRWILNGRFSCIFTIISLYDMEMIVKHSLPILQSRVARYIL